MRIRFGPFTLDLVTRQLTRQGREIQLAPKAIELLKAPVLNRPEALSKADLQEHLWPGAFVAEANLSNLVAKIRAASGDTARAPVVDRRHRITHACREHRRDGTEPVANRLTDGTGRRWELHTRRRLPTIPVDEDKGNAGPFR